MDSFRSFIVWWERQRKYLDMVTEYFLHMDSMKAKIGDVYDTMKLRTMPLTSAPLPTVGEGFSIESMSPDRVRFYLQYLYDTPGFYRVLDAYNKSSTIRNTWETALRDLVSRGNFLTAVKGNDWLEKLKAKLEANPLTKDKHFVGGVAPDEKEDAASFFKTEVDEYVKAQGDKPEQTKVANHVENHPFFSPQNADISMMDRIVFIAITYIFRLMTLFLVDWALNSRMVATFEQAFFMYTLTYILLFTICVLLVNVGNMEDDENMAFKLLFYYMNTEINGYARIAGHVIAQMSLIPIMLIVRNKSLPLDDTFEQRRSIFRVLSNLTLFLWAMTSVLAIRF